jgi:hypothetical protein
MLRIVGLTEPGALADPERVAQGVADLTALLKGGVFSGADMAALAHASPVEQATAIARSYRGLLKRWQGMAHIRGMSNERAIRRRARLAEQVIRTGQ